MSQGHISGPIQPIDFKLGRSDVPVEFYRSGHKTNFKTNSTQVRFSKTNLLENGQNSLTTGPIDLKLGRHDLFVEYYRSTY